MKLSREILTTTRPLTDDDRIDLWKARRRARQGRLSNTLSPARPGSPTLGTNHPVRARCSIHSIEAKS